MKSISCTFSLHDDRFEQSQRLYFGRISHMLTNHVNFIFKICKELVIDANFAEYIVKCTF